MRDDQTNLHSDKPETEAPRSEVGGNILDMLANIRDRLSAVERDNAGVREELEAAKSRGEVDVNLAQIRHVMHKYFPHDLPDAEPVAAPVPKFDAFTGAPLH